MHTQQNVVAAAALCGLVGIAAAAPTASSNPWNESEVKAISIIEQIMPNSTACKGQKVYPNDCRTATQAAPYIIKSFEGATAGEMAAMLALMAIESAELKYKHNVEPGVPGQGTVNMMMYKFVEPYAILHHGAEAVAAKTNESEVLDMVTPDEYNFGSARWFLQTQCTQEQQSKLKCGSEAGWKAYMDCIGVNATHPERVEYWERAKKAFGLPTH